MTTITRSARVADNFALIANGALRKSTLSFRARGLMAYLLSLPPGWKTSIRQLAEQGTEGRDAIATALNELIEAGYVTRTGVRKGGRFESLEYYVTDDPAIDIEAPLPEDEVPRPGNPDTVPPRPGNPDPVKPDPVEPDPVGQPLQRKRTTNTGRTKTGRTKRTGGGAARSDQRVETSSASSPSVTRETATERTAIDPTNGGGFAAPAYPNQCTRHQDKPNPPASGGGENCRGCTLAGRAYERAGELRVQRLAEDLELLGTMPECPHGQPGGDRPHPGNGVTMCPQCRVGAPADVGPSLDGIDFGAIRRMAEFSPS
ncbi:MAG: hypothetical protein K0R62_7883 [Nonomuraea muscovyensis]|jgi:hypothetical protein|nr:hypothetical protein [Nonomuraea muscovyensis]